MYPKYRMDSQIFKMSVPPVLLATFLDRYGIKKANHYLFTKASFKKAVFEKSVEPFCDALLEYYHISKRKYLTKHQTYRSFVTIIRQICKNRNISFTSKIKYDKSDYEIIYYIYLVDA